MSLGLGLWLAEPETLSHAGTSAFPKIRLNNPGKSTDLAASAIWDLGLDLFGLYEKLYSLRTCTHDFGVVGLHLPQASLVVLLGKAHILQELGVLVLKIFISSCLGFLDVIPVPFLGLIVYDVVLGPSQVCTEAGDS